MGLRGPPPTPAHLKLLNGNPGKRPIVPDPVSPTVELPEPPEWLCESGLAEWRRAGAELEKLSLISQLDLALFALYCQTYGRMRDLEVSIGRQVAERVAAGETREAAYEAVSVQLTPTGFRRPSAIVQLLAQHRDEVNRYAGQFGMSPSHRGRVTPLAQPSLPGFEADGWAKFRPG